MGVPLLPAPGITQPVLIRNNQCPEEGVLRKLLVCGQITPFLGRKTSPLLSQVFSPALPNIFDRIQEFAWVSGEGAEA